MKMSKPKKQWIEDLKDMTPIVGEIRLYRFMNKLSEIGLPPVSDSNIGDLFNLHIFPKYAFYTIAGLFTYGTYRVVEAVVNSGFIGALEKLLE